MKIFKLVEKPNKSISNILLFVFTFIFIFLVPLVPNNWTPYANNILFSILFFTGVYALDKVRKSVLIFAFIAFITQWIAIIFNLHGIEYISDITNVIFFQIIIIRLIMQIAKSKEVTSNVIFESINGYLLMGIMFASWVTILIYFVPQAFVGLDVDAVNLQETFYFTFVTMTTLGYGDITPQIPLAKSLTILISTSGQLYIAIIIAMLVGKFAASQQTTKD